MKKTGIIIGLLLATLPLLAEHVDLETAQKVAGHFLKNNGAKSVVLTDLSKEAGFTNLYIFNAEEGFVVMAADNCVRPILGYSFTGEFETRNMPENIRYWLQGYNDEIQFAIDNQLRATAETAQGWKDLCAGKPDAAKATPVVAPLIQTHWDQNDPYNGLCPSGTVTGCVATAMAQVMKYWNYPAHGMGSHTYIPDNNPSLGELYANFNATNYDWTNMTDTYTSSSTAVQKQAVATLMYHCGVSVDMEYGPLPTGSSASTSSVGNALKSYFNYASDVQSLRRSQYDSSVWTGMLKADLDRSWPIQYAGSGTGGGHSFVCDGYDNQDYFHFNWGWSGSCDAYYTIDNLNPGPGGSGSGAYGIYNDQQEAVLGIHPSDSTPAPTELSFTQTGRDVAFSWTAASGAVSYNIYRNSNYIGNTATTTFVDIAPYGNSDYYVRSVDSNGLMSLSSNSVIVTVDYPIPTVTDLTADLSNNTVDLNWSAPAWCFPQTASSFLTYGSGATESFMGYQGNANMYWGHRYLPSDLTGTDGKVIFRVSFFVREPGAYELYIFQGTTSMHYTEPDATYEVPTTLLVNKTLTATQLGWFTIDLDSPVNIDPSQDLWVMMYDPELKYMPAMSSKFNDHNRGSYYSANISAWTLTDDGHAFLIRTYLTDGTYTYNLYHDGVKIAENLSETTCSGVVLNDDAPNQLVVKTNYYGGEAASNMVGVTLGSSEITDLNLDTAGLMILTRGSTLTVTGAITNTAPSQLIIEDDAQLIHPSHPVQATLRKTINAYSDEPGVNNGWYTIASPVDELGIGLATTGNYDLYTYDEENTLWHNQKDSTNNIIQFNEGQGFLYAHASQKTLAFSGNMRATDDQVVVPLSCQNSYEPLRGFNLVGNPFSRNLIGGDITLGDTELTTYYSVEGGSELVSHNITTDPILPGQGFLVQASTKGQDLVFNPSGSKSKRGFDPAFICIEASDGSFTDRAYVQFNKGNTLHKMTLSDSHVQISVRQSKDDYAAINVNTENHALPLNFKAAHNGTHTLSIGIVNLDLDYLHLVDNLTGADIDLLQNPSYSFEAQTNDYASRFKLVFRSKANDDVYGDSFVDGKTIVIDMTGRVVATDRNTKLAPGVYILQTINGSEIQTEKIIIH